MSDRRVVEMFASQQADVREFQERLERLKDGDGDGTSVGVTGDWKIDVERRLGQLHEDVRKLLLAGVFVATLVCGLYLYFNTKFEAVNQRLSAIETQQARDAAVLNGKLDLLVDRKERKAE